MRAITSVAFSPDAKLIVSGGTDEDFTIMVWDVEAKALLATEKALNKTEVLHFAWNPKAPTEFCGVGKGTVGFYALAANKIQVKLG